jgi:hypothetical protein
VTFPGNNFFDLATWLCGSGSGSGGQRTDEAAIRTAIGRAYYAAYLLAREALVHKRWTPNGSGSDHKAVPDELKLRGEIQLSGDLRKLHRLRGHADYHLQNNSGYSKTTCQYCKKHKASGSTGAVVTIDHWLEAVTLANTLIPALQKY